MVVGNGVDLLKSLMKLQSNCPNCGTTLTFEDSARLGRDNGVSENAIMCHNCRKVFNVNILPDKMEISNELTKYNFATVNKEVTKSVAKQETKPNVKKQTSTQNVKQDASANVNPVQTKQNAVYYAQPQGMLGSLQNNKLGRLLFFKTDAEYGVLRLSKTKILSELWFILMFALMAINMYSSFFYVELVDIIATFVLAVLYTVPIFVIGWLVARHLDKKVTPIQSANVYQQAPVQNNTNQAAQNQNVVQETSVEEPVVEAPKVEESVPEVEEPVVEAPKVEEPAEEVVPEANQNQYFEKDNVGTFQDDVSKANAYWLGERLAKEEKDPFTLYMFTSSKDAEEALLELPYIHKASDTGRLICDDVLIYGFYEVAANNYEAIICGKDLTLEQFEQAEDSFKKHGGKLRNNLKPEESVESTESEEPTESVKEEVETPESEEPTEPVKEEVETPEESSSSVKFRETLTKNQYTYECYDADTKRDAIEFLKGKTVDKRLYYICVYTPEGDFGRDIDGMYQM